MISFLFPGFLYAAAGVALGVVVLHFLVTEQPRSDVLPTVRFFPDVVARSTSITIRPSDLWLLLLRVLTILLIGAAFAQPRLAPGHRAIARIVAVDLSRAVGQPAELADSARKYAAGAAALIVFDDHAREIAPSALTDSLTAFVAQRENRRARGAITPALITALRAAARLRDGADSIELVIVSPFVREETDAAFPTVRALLPGGIRAVRVAAARDGASGAATAPTPQVEWADSGSTAQWESRRVVDTIGAVRAGDVVLIYPFARRWRLKLVEDSATDATTHVYARWSDGEPAAIERTIGADCVRSLAIPMPAAGDAILRPEFARFSAALSAPCGAGRDFAMLPPAFMNALEGGAGLTPASAVRPRATRMTPLVPWLLGGALLLALMELALRRPRSTARGAAAASGANDGRNAA